MSLKKLRTKLETLEILDNSSIGMVFKKCGKYYQDYERTKEVAKSVVEAQDLSIIIFRKS